MASTETPEIRLLVSLEESRNGPPSVLKFTARFVYITNDGKIRNPSGSFGENWEAELADLAITAQADRDDGNWYAWSVEYAQPYSIDLRRAETHVKTLRRVQKHLDKLQAKYGRPTDLVAYVARVGEAFKVSLYGWAVDRAHTYDDGDYRWGDVDTLRFHTDEWVRKIVNPEES